MFVGISCRDEGIIKVYNFADASKNHQLTGHKVSGRCAASTSQHRLHHQMDAHAFVVACVLASVQAR